MTKSNVQIFGVIPLVNLQNNIWTAVKRRKMRCRTLICFRLSCFIVLFWCRVFGRFFLKIQYNKYNTIIEHISTPVPTVDNIRIQIYMHMLYIHNRQKDTSIQTESWTKYFIDRYLPCTMSDWLPVTCVNSLNLKKCLLQFINHNSLHHFQHVNAIYETLFLLSDFSKTFMQQILHGIHFFLKQVLTRYKVNNLYLCRLGEE